MTSELLRHVARIVWFVVVCFALQSAPSFARAQHESDEYKQLIAQALDEFKRQNWPEARVLFRRAHELFPNARTLRGMGVVSFEMRDYVQAVRDLSAAIADERQPLTREQFSEAKTLLGRAKTFVATFTLNVTPTDALVKIDGVTPVAEADGSFLLAFGRHTVSAEREGYESEQTQIDVSGGEHGEIKLALRPIQSGAAVAALPVPASPVKSAPRPAEREHKTGGLKWTWLTLGATAAFGGTAAALWVLGGNELDELDRRCAREAESGTPCERGEVETDSVERYQRLTNVSLGVAGAALIATAALAIVEWPRTERRPIAFGVGAGSLSVRGAF